MKKIPFGFVSPKRNIDKIDIEHLISTQIISFSGDDRLVVKCEEKIIVLIRDTLALIKMVVFTMKMVETFHKKKFYPY